MNVLKFFVVFFVILTVITLVFVLSLYIFFSFFYTEPKYITDYNQNQIGVNIQPLKAIEMALPYLDEHATYIFKNDEKLTVHLVKHKKYYYVKKTNYPAKTFRFYMYKAVKIDANTGEISFIK